MISKIDFKTILIFLLIISQLYVFYKIHNHNNFDSINVKNIEIRDSQNIRKCEITESGRIYFYNIKGDVILEFGQIGDKNGGGIKLYDSNGNLATFIDNRIINTYSNDSTYSSSIGRDMKNNGFIALLDSTGKVFYIQKK